MSDPADLRGRRRLAGLETEHQVADDLAVVLGDEGQGVAGDRWGDVGVELLQLLGDPGLVERTVQEVADHVGLGVVAQHAGQVQRDGGAQQESLGADRQGRGVGHPGNLSAARPWRAVTW
jgi:hypothetical protein